MEIKLKIGVISRDNSEYCHYAIPENRAQDREKPRKISRIRAWGERGGLAHPKHRLVVARYDGLIASYLGETASRLRKLFDYVRTRACVLFFDEFDTIGKERGDLHETGEIKRVVSSLLMQIDDLPSHVVVVTATNHPELLDRAVWRRFQLRLELPRPTPKEIEDYFATVGSRLKFSLEVSPKSLAEKFQGASYSELEDFVSDVSRRYVLALPEPNVKKIVQQRLAQWQNRFKISQSS